MIVFLQQEEDDPELPFCERCGEWTAPVFQLELVASADSAAAEHLRRGEAAALAKLPARAPGAETYTLVCLFRSVRSRESA